MDTNLYAARQGVTVEIVRDRGAQVDGDGWEHHAYTLRLHRAGTDATMETPWRQGYGVEDSPVDMPGTVLDSLVSDASVGGESFEDFCADLGYDTDSRKAHTTWEACRATVDQLTTFLGGSSELRALMYDVERI